jgi:Protein of unknown function (DUF1571)
MGARSSLGGAAANPVAAPKPVGRGSGASVSTSPLAKPLQLIDQARQVMQKVENYSCVMVKQERIRGKLEPENLIDLKVKQRPFSVYMRWLGPRSFAGQEVCFVAGRNQNMMRVHAAGLKGLAGFISISPNSPLVVEHSRHRITEAGLANMIDQLGRAWSEERAAADLKVSVAEYEYNHRRCDRVEVLRPRPNGNPSADHRTVVYFDREHHLPVRLERYDWPRSGGAAGGDLLECYSYVNLRFNGEMPDRIFNH